MKYPRTLHLQGSRLPPGKVGADQVPYAQLVGEYIVVEEKMEADQAGLSYDDGANQVLQHRGSILGMGAREKRFALWKAWAAAHEERLFDVLGNRFVMFGEWMRVKHTVFYDQLPHYFLEFDVFDRNANCFLSTAARQALLAPLPVVSVPILYEGRAPRRLEDLLALLRPSQAKSAAWRDALEEEVRRQGLDLARVWQETDDSDLPEGLYIKVERDDQTVDRLKWVRQDFLQTILASGSHWQDRPEAYNQLAPGVDIFSATVAGWPKD